MGDTGKKSDTDDRTAAFQHGFMVGFMNGVRLATEAIGSAIREGINASTQTTTVTDVYLEHSCQSPICLNFRPGSTDYCSPECERADRAWERTSRVNTQ